MALSRPRGSGFQPYPLSIGQIDRRVNDHFVSFGETFEQFSLPLATVVDPYLAKERAGSRYNIDCPAIILPEECADGCLEDIRTLPDDDAGLDTIAITQCFRPFGKVGDDVYPLLLDPKS